MNAGRSRNLMAAQDESATIWGSGRVGDGALHELAKVLSDETAHLKKLLPLLEEEHQALIRADVGAVAQITERKETLMTELRTLETARRDSVGRLASSLGVRAETLTLSSILKMSAQPMPALAKLRDELQGLVATMSSTNRRNGALVQQSLGYLRGLFSALVSGVNQPATYAPTGRSTTGTSSLQLLDRQA